MVLFGDESCATTRMLLVESIVKSVPSITRWVVLVGWMRMLGVMKG